MQYLLHAKIVEIKDRFTSDDGATAVEYGVMVAAIIAVIIAVVFAIGTSVQGEFQSVNNALN